MRTICLYFQVHQPLRLRRYRFFDIGNNDYYYDDYTNESIINSIAERSYIPANEILLGLIKKYKGRFKVTFSISGVALVQMEQYAPHVLKSFQKLADTNCVEFLAETNSHSLVSLKDKKEFAKQVKAHSNKIEKYFGQKPKVFRNTELIYSDQIGADVYKLGFKGMLIEGAKHILGYNSPNYLYCNAVKSNLKILCRNYALSDDIAFRFSNNKWNEHPLTAKKYAGWINSLPPQDEIVNIFIDYETFGEHQAADTGIFEFLKYLPNEILKNNDVIFDTPTRIINKHQVKSTINAPYPASWADEEKDLSAWLGNDLQNEACDKLYSLKKLVNKIKDEKIKLNWEFLQTSDHFYYMSTKILSDGEVHNYFNPFESPYDAFINYMNILSDFQIRIKKSLNPNFELNKEEMLNLLTDKEENIKQLKKQVKKLKMKNKTLDTHRTQKIKTTDKKKTDKERSKEAQVLAVEA